MRSLNRRLREKFLCFILAGVLWMAWARAAVINVGPSDSYTKIESANPGDQVVIAPGSYAFRVYLTKQAPVTNPITIRAQDPLNRPVWDFRSEERRVGEECR